MLEHGIPPHPRQGRLQLAIQTAIFIEMLGDGGNPTRASDVARAALAAMDHSLANNKPGDAIACRKGCSYCCHNFAGATVPELLLIARFVRDQPAGYQRDLESTLAPVAERSRGVGDVERYLQRMPCGLLADDLCSVYAVRPLPCRGMASTSLSACERSWDLEEVEIPIPRAYQLLREYHVHALKAALKFHGLEWKSYDITTGAECALRTQDAEARWLAGEGVFRDADEDADAPGAGAFYDQVAQAAKEWIVQ